MKTLEISYLQAVEPLSEQDHPVTQLDMTRAEVRGIDALARVNQVKGEVRAGSLPLCERDSRKLDSSPACLCPRQP